MSSEGGKPGQALATIGGLGLAISLWLPWYTINIPQSALNSVNQFSQQLGALGSLVRSGALLISQLGPFHITAWEAYTTTPAVLLTAAIVGGGLALLALSDRAGSTSQLTMLAGGVAALLVGYRIAVTPWQNSFVSPAWGIYVALLSSLAMLAGGFLSERGDAAEPLLAAPLPAVWPPPVLDTPTPPTDGWSMAQSVPPPRA